MPETTATKEWIAGTRALSRRILAILIDHDKPDQAREALAYVCSELIATGEDLEDVRDGIDELEEEDAEARDAADDVDETYAAEVADDLDAELSDILGEDFKQQALDRALTPFPRILPFPRVEFRAGERKQINVQPQIPIQPRKLLIPSTIGLRFLVHDLLVNGDSQFAGGSVSAVVFSEHAVGVQIPMPSMKAGDVLTLDVERIPDDPIAFTCLVDCDAAEDAPNVPPVS